ncbi:AMP-binding enzyme family protein [Mycobacterium xenopi 3993]|nr:AMP-binding enzyme family protein [Mycobacterium xenopi 3993]
MPFFHVGGALGMLGSLYSGHTTVVQDRFDAGDWLRLVQAHRVSSVFLVPTMLQRILDHPDFGRTDLSSLVAIAYGAAAAPVALVRRAMAALPNVAFANVFGQTETLGAYTTLSPEDHRDPTGWARWAGHSPELRCGWSTRTRAWTSRRGRSAKYGSTQAKTSRAAGCVPATSPAKIPTATSIPPAG